MQIQVDLKIHWGDVFMCITYSRSGGNNQITTELGSKTDTTSEK